MDDGPEELEAEAIAHETQKRWGEPTEEPRVGQCIDCGSYLRLSYDYGFFAHGVCTNGDSSFDGRVVRETSGCPEFLETGKSR